MKETFKLRLQTDIARHFSRQALLLSALLLALFLFFSFVTQQYGIYQDTKRLETNFHQLITTNQKLIKTLNKGLVRQYLHLDLIERDVYQQFYSEQSSKTATSQLLIFDKKAQVRLVTDNQLLPVARSLSLKVSLLGAKSAKPLVTFLLDNDGNHYLAMIAPLKTKQALEGYSVLLVKGNDFLAFSKNIDSKYVIADSFDHIFSSSSDTFLLGSLDKLNSSLLESPIIFYQKESYLFSRITLAPDISLYVYRRLLPVATIMIVALVVSSSIFLILVWQSYNLGQRIASQNSLAIETLVKEMEEVSQQEKEKIDLQTNDEFSYLAQQINLMIGRLKKLNHHALTLEKEKGLFERRMLEAQFHPHFLYNTLETILVTSQFDADLTEKLVLQLTKLLRYSLNHADQEETLVQDLAIIESYLRINQVRFEQLTYHIQFDDSLKDMVIPKLCLLPLVENSIKYGYQYRHDLKIMISVERQDDEVLFTVTDNGPGISLAQEKRIRSYLEKGESHHGVVNSYRRLSYFFGTAEPLFRQTASGFSVSFRVKEKNHV